MEMFNNKIEVGMQAMIIGTRQERHACYIGKIVTVEYLTERRGEIPVQYLLEEFVPVTSSIQGAVVFLEEISIEGMQPGYSHINRKYLMPLPPLKESERQKEKELERV